MAERGLTIACGELTSDRTARFAYGADGMGGDNGLNCPGFPMAIDRDRKYRPGCPDNRRTQKIAAKEDFGALKQT